MYENKYDAETEVESDPTQFQGMSGRFLISHDVVEYKGLVWKRRDQFIFVFVLLLLVANVYELICNFYL